MCAGTAGSVSDWCMCARTILHTYVRSSVCIRISIGINFLQLCSCNGLCGCSGMRVLLYCTFHSTVGMWAVQCLRTYITVSCEIRMYTFLTLWQPRVIIVLVQSMYVHTYIHSSVTHVYVCTYVHIMYVLGCPKEHTHSIPGYLSYIHTYVVDKPGMVGIF